MVVAEQVRRSGKQPRRIDGLEARNLREEIQRGDKVMHIMARHQIGYARLKEFGYVKKRTW